MQLVPLLLGASTTTPAAPDVSEAGLYKSRIQPESTWFQRLGPEMYA
jgi:hypothetical protein